jgi:hypothetical protein
MNKDKNSDSETNSDFETTKIFKEMLRLVIIPIVVSIIVGLVVGFLVFDYQYNNTLKNERKNLANGFLNDIEYVNRSLAVQLSTIDNPANPDYQKNYMRVTTNIYPTWGLYYSKNQDIEKLGSPVSIDLYNFYYEILTAEDERILYINYDAMFPIEPSINLTSQNENRKMVRLSLVTGQYNFMHDCYYSKIPKLKAELGKIRDE